MTKAKVRAVIAALKKGDEVRYNGVKIQWAAALHAKIKAGRSILWRHKRYLPVVEMFADKEADTPFLLCVDHITGVRATKKRKAK